MSDRHAEAIAFAERAIELAATLGLPAPARALGLRGGARFALGDAGGLDDTRRALEAALGQGLGAILACSATISPRTPGGPGDRGHGWSWRARARPSPSGGDRRMGAAARRPDRGGAG